jgi:membrane protein DedA with SNARE-associated domain
VDFLIESGGYLGIVLFLVLTGCGLPIPEEFPIVFAGIMSSQGTLDPWFAFLSCLIGALLGDSAMYAIGYHFGHSLAMRHPKLSKLIGGQREASFEHAIERHMFKVMVLARFMVGVRGPVYLSAGVVRVPFRQFIMYDMLCATMVVGTFFSVAYYFGDHITDLLRDAEWTLTLIVILVLLIAALWWLRKEKQPIIDETVIRHATQAESPSEVPE